MDALHTAYTAPPGDCVLVVSHGSSNWTDMRFIFGAAPQKFRIARIWGLCGSLNFVFEGEGATPHEATVFFAKNPFSTGLNFQYQIAVTNLTSGDEQLQITVLGNPPVNPPLDPPCGV